MTRLKPRPCALCKSRPRSTHVIGPDLCDPCHEYAGWENAHSDEAHDSLSRNDPTEASYLENCPICNDVPPPWETPIEEPEMTATKTAPARRNPSTKHMSHAACSHPRTPAGRAACRKSMRAGTPTPEVISVLHVRATGSKTIHLATADPNGLHAPACPSKIKNLETAEVFTLTAPAPTCKACLKVAADAE